jgi:hypothetical protein
MMIRPDYHKAVKIMAEIENKQDLGGDDSQTESCHSFESELNMISNNEETLILHQIQDKSAKQPQLDLKNEILDLKSKLYTKMGTKPASKGSFHKHNLS